jgi:hypothetical protein
MLQAWEFWLDPNPGARLKIAFEMSRDLMGFKVQYDIIDNSGVWQMCESESRFESLFCFAKRVYP